ncbi:reverse transcriptase family protein [Methylomicrobium lacus]|uniref:reverse transcriptase family protein n=1 Tax=Methylomicrobium lacus TaxID=136992 RepID=UPI001378616E|nr:reverse transcriptase family protein [Methylomicrobium lacus]
MAEILGISKDDIERLTKGGNLYNEWDEVNEKGKSRHIENPRHELKRTQRKIANLLSRIIPPDFLYCPVKDRSYITNAKQHIGQRNVRCLDIKAYFTATTSRRVYWFFHNYMDCPKDVAGILTALSTYNGHLPTGSPLSPILSYFSHIEMWEEISNLVQQNGCILTVYMDDLTVSGEKVTPYLMWQIRRQIHRFGLSYHKEKHYHGNFSEITGIIIKDKMITLPNRQHLKKHLLQRALAKTIDPNEKNKIALRLHGCNAQITQLKHSMSSAM